MKLSEADSIAGVEVLRTGAAGRGAPEAVTGTFLSRLRRFVSALGGFRGNRPADRMHPVRPPGKRASGADVPEIYEHLLRNTSHFLNFIDRDYVYRAFSEPYLRLHGKSRDDIVGRSMRAVWGDEIFEERLRPLIDLAILGRTAVTEDWVNLPGNVRRYHKVEYRACRDTDGKVIGVVGSGQDLTESREAEAALRESEARYRAVTDATNDVVWDWNLTTDNLWWSEKFASAFGYAPEAVEPGIESWYNRIHSDDRDRVIRGIHAIIESGASMWSDEYRFMRGDGSVVFIYDRGFVIHDSAGMAVRMIGAMMDITARKRAEEEQAVLLTRNKALVQGLGEIVYEVWVMQNRVHWDGEYTRILGYSPDEIGTSRASWEQRVHPDDLGRVLSELRDAQMRGGLFNVEYRFRRRDGSYLWMLDRGQMFFDENGDRVRTVGVFKDISERKRSEEALRENQRRLELALEALEGGVWDWDLRSGEIYRSPKWRQMLGYRPGEYRSDLSAWKDVIHPDDRARVVRDLRAHLDGSTPELSVQYRMRAEGGRWLWVETRGRVIERAADGTPLRAIGAAIDVTRRKLVETALESRARQAEFIGELTRKAVAGRDLVEMLDLAVSGIAAILGVEFAGVLELIPGVERLLVRAGVGWQAGIVGVRTVPDAPDSLAVFTLRSNEPVVFEDLATELRFRPPQLLRDHGIVSGVSVVIGDVSRPYGILGVHTTKPRKFDAEDLRFIESVANVIAEAVHSRQTERMVAQSRERLRNLAARMGRMREEDHRRIAREIHDELGQTLTGLRIDLAWMLERLPARRPELAERAKSAMALADQTLATVRRISHDLRPAMLDDLGLAAAMEWQIGDFAKRTGCRCSMDLDAGPIGMDNERDIVVFRVLQEALTNIARHAGASRVQVSMGAPDGKLTLEIADNGCGISDEALRSNVSIGLIGMRERVGSLGGRIRITRGTAGGTTVHMEMPLRRD